MAAPFENTRREHIPVDWTADDKHLNFKFKLNENKITPAGLVPKKTNIQISVCKFEDPKGFDSTSVYTTQEELIQEYYRKRAFCAGEISLGARPLFNKR